MRTGTVALQMLTEMTRPCLHVEGWGTGHNGSLFSGWYRISMAGNSQIGRVPIKRQNAGHCVRGALSSPESPTVTEASVHPAWPGPAAVLRNTVASDVPTSHLLRKTGVQL